MSDGTLMGAGPSGLAHKYRLGIGYLELASAQFCVGLNVISGKFLMGYFPIFLLLSLRCLIGLAIMWWVAASKGSAMSQIFSSFMVMTRRDRLLFVFQAACGCFLFNVLILYGMRSTSATSAGIISSITPVMTFILAAIFLKEQIVRQKWISILIVMLGLVVLSFGDAEDSVENALLGNFLVFLAVIPEAMFTILSKSIGGKLSQTEAVILVNIINLILFIPLALWDYQSFHIEAVTLQSLGVLGSYGISGGVLFFLLWYRGLEKVPANTAALFTGVMPISTTVLAFYFLQESIGGADLIGMALVIIAIIIGCRTPAKTIRDF